MRVFTRQEEELNLAHCGGTCNNSGNCAMITDFGFKRAGTAFVNQKCVLCCRKEVTNKFNHLMLCGKSEGVKSAIYNPYMVCNTDYPSNVFVDADDRNAFRGITGPFVRYNINDYQKVGPEQLKQTLPTMDCLNWYDVLLDLRRSNFLKSAKDNPWFLSACSTKKCRQDILTIVGQYKSIGMTNVVYDLNEQRTKCSKCLGNVRYKHADQTLPMTLLEYKDVFYTKCLFCDIIIRYNKLQTAQACDTCCVSLQEKAFEQTKVCERCGVPVTVNRRGGVKMNDPKTGKIVYYCKSHKIK